MTLAQTLFKGDDRYKLARFRPATPLNILGEGSLANFTMCPFYVCGGRQCGMMDRDLALTCVGP